MGPSIIVQPSCNIISERKIVIIKFFIFFAPLFCRRHLGVIALQTGRTSATAYDLDDNVLVGCLYYTCLLGVAGFCAGVGVAFGRSGGPDRGKAASYVKANGPTYQHLVTF